MTLGNAPGLQLPVFERCLGKEFIVTAITGDGHAELQVEAVTGTSDDKIYVPLRFLKIV